MTSEHGPARPGEGKSRSIDRAVVHDIANLLTAAMANARLIRRNATDAARVAELAGDVESQALRALKMIEKATEDQRGTE